MCGGWSPTTSNSALCAWGPCLLPLPTMWSAASGQRRLPGLRAFGGPLHQALLRDLRTLPSTRGLRGCVGRRRETTWPWAGNQSPTRVVVPVLQANHPGVPGPCQQGWGGGRGPALCGAASGREGGGNLRSGPAESTRSPWKVRGCVALPCPHGQDPGRRGPRKRQTPVSRWGLSAEERPALPAPRTPAGLGLAMTWGVSVRAVAGRELGGLFSEDEQRRQVWVGALDARGSAVSRHRPHAGWRSGGGVCGDSGEWFLMTTWRGVFSGCKPHSALGFRTA